MPNCVALLPGGRQPRLDEARRDRVDVDPQRRPLARERLREPDHAGLGGRVVGVEGDAVDAVDRRDVHDLAVVRRVLPAQQPGRGAADVEGPLAARRRATRSQVSSLIRCSVESLGQAGVVDDDVERPELALRDGDHLVGGRRVGDAPDRDHRVRDLRGGLAGDVLVDVVDDDRSAVLGEPRRRSPCRCRGPRP